MRNDPTSKLAKSLKTCDLARSLGKGNASAQINARLAALETINAAVTAPYTLDIELFDGANFTLIATEDVCKSIFVSGAFEPEIGACIERYCGPGDHCLDIGAHVGYFTRVLASVVGEAGKVCAFEPVPDTFSLLTRNAQDLPQVHLIEAACTDRAGTTSIKYFGRTWSAFSTVGTSRLPDGAPETYEELSIKTVTVDEMVALHDLHPKFVKLDAENSEVAVLKGMARTIANHRPAIVIEVGDSEGHDQSLDALFMLMDHGYDIYDLHMSGIRPHAPLETGTYSYDNLLAVHTQDKRVDRLNRL
ncbi:MAG: FkbM family methyltransferase [Pseudomonadota bacterium]